MRRAARSGMLSPKLFQLRCERPEPVKPTMSQSTGKRRRVPSSYCGGSHTASLRTCGSPQGFVLRTLETCSSTTTVPEGPFCRLSMTACILLKLGHLSTWLEKNHAQLRVLHPCGGYRRRGLLAAAYRHAADRRVCYRRAVPRPLRLRDGAQVRLAPVAHPGLTA